MGLVLERFEHVMGQQRKDWFPPFSSFHNVLKSFRLFNAQDSLEQG